MRMKVSTIPLSNRPLPQGERLQHPIVFPFSMREKGQGMRAFPMTPVYCLDGYVSPHNA
jgi:hypothetical protein